MRDILTSPRIIEIKRNRRVRRVRLTLLLAALFLSCVGALGYFSSDRHVVITTMQIAGTRILNQSDIESVVRNNLAGKYFYIFSRANSLIYPHKKIYADLVTAFPRIENLKVVRTGWNTLSISITERSGSYLYCGVAIPSAQTEIGENCYFVNGDGYIFDKAPYFSGNVYVKYYGQLPSGSDNPLGQQLRPPSRFHEILRFVNGVTALGLEPVSVVLDGDNLTDTLYLAHNPLETNPQIIFKDDDDLVTILDNLSLAMKKPEFANEIKSKYATLLYIDLRFKNKVLYKFN